MHPGWKISNMRRRVNRAQNFPDNTCPASRHLHSIADCLLDKSRKFPIEECWDAEHMASTMLAVLESLWKARTKLKKKQPNAGTR